MENIISAAPGYYVLAYLGEGIVSREPVVCWRVGPADSFATPIVLDTERGYRYTNPPILCPDGQVISPFRLAWHSEQEWLDDMRKKEGAA
jgi:hypothetical protein